MPSSRKQKQGKAKIGRENENEPVQASSNQLSAKRLMPIFEPHVKSAFQTALRTHHRLRGIAGSQPGCISPMRKRKTPTRSEQSVPKPQGMATSLVGVGCFKKPTPAAERHGEYITRWIGPCPTRKRADVEQVNRWHRRPCIRGGCAGP